MPSQPKVAVLASGGLDSAILIDYFLKRSFRVKPIYIQSGHVWEKAELFWLKRFLKAIRNKRLEPVVSLEVPVRALYHKNHWSMTGKKVPDASSRDKAVYLPGKNLLLITHGAIVCARNRIPRLALGPLKTNPFPDASRTFFKKIASVCAEGLDMNIQIDAPFLTYTKKRVMKLGEKLPLGLTFSCIRPRRFIHCGRCNKCAERKKAFQDARLPDLTTYRDGSFHRVVSK